MEIDVDAPNLRKAYVRFFALRQVPATRESYDEEGGSALFRLLATVFCVCISEKVGVDRVVAEKCRLDRGRWYKHCTPCPFDNP